MRVARLISIMLLRGGCRLCWRPRSPPAGRRNRPGANNPRLLVANPHSFSSADSAPAVAVGDGIRGRIERLVGSQFRVLTRSEMNEALKQFGYPADAILAPMTQRVLAQSLNSRGVVVSTIPRIGSGRYEVTARLAGVNDDAGSVVSATQAAGQPLADLGGKVGEGFGPAIKAWRRCQGVRGAGQDRAGEGRRGGEEGPGRDAEQRARQLLPGAARTEPRRQGGQRRGHAVLRGGGEG